MKLLRQHRRSGAALIIVLAFVVLLTVLALAYFSRTVTDRQVAQSSFRQTNADQLALSAADVIVADLKQEIITGSASPAPTFGPTASPGPYYLYVPSPSPNILPVPDGTPSDKSIPNLVKRSVQNDNPASPAVGSRASAVNSTSPTPSPNGRSVTSARWNSHYLIPLGSASPSPASSPVSSFVAPDWVFVTNQGPTVITSPSTSVIGRYAYAIYDEGGLLDMNAAGYPSPTTIMQYGRKGSLAFADLKGLGSFGLSTTGIDALVGWRNYASSQPSGDFSSNFNFSTTAANTYYNFILSDPNYIKLTSYSPNYFLTTSQAPAYNNRTDQAFTTRQELIKFFGATPTPSPAQTPTQNALQYLGTFSREASAAIPQWTGPSPTPTSTNPNFQTLWVTRSFTRNDGTTANRGDYLVNKRFLLQRLNWLTYEGPSASRTPIPTSAPAIGNANYDMWLLTSRFGLTSTFLLQGTDLSQAGQTGSTANIYKYFGLVWDSTNERWNYIGHPASPTATSPLATSIATFGVGGTQSARREPDFFELLQAGILSSSVGDFSPSDPALPITHQQSTMLHILTIGANLIAQTRVDSYPVRIAFSNGGTTMEAVGSPRLPYLSSLAACPVAGTSTAGPTQGGINWFLVPNLWDPFRDTWDLTEANASNIGNGPVLTPGYLRPTVRITVNGTAALGTVAASSVVTSGRVASTAPVTTLSGTTLPIPSTSLTLASGMAVGRDGLLEASRLGPSDINGTVPPYATTTSPPSASTGWSSINPVFSGTPNFIVFRLSVPGSAIPSSANGKNPVLILNPPPSTAGFQMTLDYQSPTTTTKWYSYSYLQGNNAPSTWISSPGLYLVTSFSKYGYNPGPPIGTSPTVVLSSNNTATLWDNNVPTLAQAPIFAKADPRSIRYNSQIGVVNLPGVIPAPTPSAGVIGSIWPNGYAAAPTMSPGPAPPAPMFSASNPVTYSQTTGDNVADHGNPYNESYGIADASNPYRPVMMNRPFRSVGEMGYAFRDQPFRTLSFSSANSPDAGLLDLFSVNDYSDPSGMRGGVVNLNSRQASAIAGLLTSTIRREDTPRMFTGAPSPSPSPLASPPANSVATSLVLSTSTASLLNRAGLPTLIANETGLGPSVPKTQRESIARALGEADQTRTWNLMIDVIAQSGHYKPNPTSLQNDFIVEGEQRYWVHVAIDRFTGQVIDRQIEAVKE